MLNEKALEAAAKAFDDAYDARPVGKPSSILLILRAAIEAYLAALPDEGGQFPEHFWLLASRWASTTNNDRKAELASELVDLVEAWHADALEAARAKLGIDKPEASEV